MSEALFKESYDNSEDKGEEVVGEVVSFLQVKDGKAYAKVRKVGENTTQTVVRQYEEEELDPNPAHDEEKQVAQDTFENIENREAKELMTKMIDEPVKVKHFENKPIYDNFGQIEFDAEDAELIRKQEEADKISSEKRVALNKRLTKGLEELETFFESEDYKQDLERRRKEIIEKKQIAQRKNRRGKILFSIFMLVFAAIGLVGFKDGFERIKTSEAVQMVVSGVEDAKSKIPVNTEKSEEESSISKDERAAVVRNLVEQDFKIEPTNRTSAWNSELPDFMLEDIKLLNTRKNKNKKLKYEFEDTVLWMYSEDGRTILSVEDNQEMHHEYVDFSIYFDNDKNLIIYGYSTDLNPAFYREKISGIVSEIQTVAKHSAVPFNSEMVTMELSNALKSYLMEFMNLTPEDMRKFAIAYDNAGNIGVYHKGQPVTNIREAGEIVKAEKCLGLLLNKESNLIFPYFTVSSNGGIIFKVSNIGSAQDITAIQYAVAVNGSVQNFPVIKKESQDFIVLPKNMDLYEKYCTKGYLEEDEVLEFEFRNLFSENN